MMMAKDIVKDISIRVKLSELGLEPKHIKFLQPGSHLDLEGFDEQVKSGLSYLAKRILRDAREKVFQFEFHPKDGYTKVVVTDGKHQQNIIHLYGKGFVEQASCDCEEYLDGEASLCEHIVVLQQYINGYHMNFTPEQQVERNRIKRLIKTAGRIKNNYVFKHYCSLHNKCSVIGAASQSSISIDSPSFTTLSKIAKQYNTNSKIDIADDECDSLLRGITLYPYQKDILRAMAGAKCSVCAMKVGSGKTLTAIAYLEWLKRNHHPQIKMLMVGPKSLLMQWQAEIVRTTDFPVHVIKNMKQMTNFLNAHGPLVGAVTYQFVQRNADSIKELPAVDMVILDEIQYIRNDNAKTWLACKEIIVDTWKSPYTVALSGTIIENQIDDLYSIMQVIDSKSLPTKWKFESMYKNEAGISGLAVRYTGSRNVNELKKRLSHRVFGYNSTNNAIKLSHNWIPIKLNSTEKRLQDDYENQAKELQAKIATMEYPPRKLKLLIQALLLKARQACNGVPLAKGYDNVVKEGGSLYSTKVETIGKLLQRLLDEGKKVVVYSEWVEMLKLIANDIQSSLSEKGWGYLVFTGGKTAKQRHDAVQRFQSDPNSKILFSSDAGGMGLDGLQHVSHTIIHAEMPWNPARLDQRNGRLNRNLQKHDVDAYYIFAENGIESRMRGILDDKRAIRESVIDGLTLDTHTN